MLSEELHGTWAEAREHLKMEHLYRRAEFLNESAVAAALAGEGLRCRQCRKYIRLLELEDEAES